MQSLQLLYHELREAQSRYSYVMTRAAFDEQCRLFSTLQRESSQAWILPEVTFDDGHLSNLTMAAPVLEAHGLRARFFITVGWTGERANYMGWAQLRELHARGHSIGAHGMTHALLTGCSDAQLAAELDAARKLLEDGLGQEVRTMSLPGGRANARVLQACRDAGYAKVFTSVPRAETYESAGYTVGRLNLLGGTTVAWLQDVLDPASGLLQKLERNDRLKQGAKRLLGDRLYAQLWAIGNRQEREPKEHGTIAR